MKTKAILVATGEIVEIEIGETIVTGNLAIGYVINGPGASAQLNLAQPE